MRQKHAIALVKGKDVNGKAKKVVFVGTVTGAHNPRNHSEIEFCAWLNQRWIRFFIPKDNIISLVTYMEDVVDAGSNI